MNHKSNKQIFWVSAAVTLSAVLVLGGVLGFVKVSGAATAADALPSGLNATDIGKGGADPSSVELVADTPDFQVWTARDRAKNICVISLAKPEGNSASFCVDEEQFLAQGLPSSMLVGTSEEGDTSATMLQTYLLPQEADMSVAAELIPGSAVYESLLVRYGPLTQERTTVISVPTKSGTIALTVFGRDSL